MEESGTEERNSDTPLGRERVIKYHAHIYNTQKKNCFEKDKEWQRNVR